VTTRGCGRRRSTRFDSQLGITLSLTDCRSLPTPTPGTRMRALHATSAATERLELSRQAGVRLRAWDAEFALEDTPKERWLAARHDAQLQGEAAGLRDLPPRKARAGGGGSVRRGVGCARAGE